MKAALALVFFACIAGSMATDARGQFLDQLVQQGTAIAQTVVGQLQQQILSLAQNVVSQLGQLTASLGRFSFNFDEIVSTLKPILAQHVNTLLAHVLSGIQGLIGGGRAVDIGAIFTDFANSVIPAITGIGQHLLNQGLNAVIGALGGSRGIGDIFAGLSEQVSGLVSSAGAALTGAWNGLVEVGGAIVDASKPHLAQLGEQLVGHGLNALNSVSETINNLHGSLVGGR
jgi:hypothetical protein